ncbi:hypothetical protein HFO69_26280 [Rhizobium laguerreae]|nr:hypothetical protein [Rhizobium laguerreae]
MIGGSRMPLSWATDKVLICEANVCLGRLEHLPLMENARMFNGDAKKGTGQLLPLLT